MPRHPDGARLARVVASDLVAYFHEPGSPLAGSESSAREFAAHGLSLLRARFGHDEALERYYADCIGSAFEVLTLRAPQLQPAARPFVERPLPPEELSLVFGR